MRFLFLIIFSIFISVCIGQQDPAFTMYRNNFTLYNPAYTGILYKHFGSINGRIQGSGNIQQKTASFHYETKLEKFNSGLGLAYIYDSPSPLFSDNRLILNYAYHLKIKESTLAFGLSSEYRRISIDFSQAILQDPNDPLIPSKEKESQGKLNYNFGLFYRAKNLELGASVTHFNTPRYEKLNAISSDNLFLTGAYNFKLSDNLEFKPSLRFIVPSLQSTIALITLNALLTFNKKYWVGLAHNIGASNSIMLGVDFKEKLRVGYSLDLYTNYIGRVYNNTGHEVTLGFIIK